MTIKTRKEEKQLDGSSKALNIKLKLGYIIYCLTVLAICFCPLVLADGDPIAVVNNLSDFIFSLIRAIGMILMGFGIVQIGLSMKGHDPSQRANGFMTLAGGVVITFAKEILAMIAG